MPTFQETIFVDKDLRLTVTADSGSSGYVIEVTPGEVNNELFTVLASNSVVITSSLSAKTYLIVSTLGKLTTSLTQGVGGGIAALVDDTAPQLGGVLNLNGNNLVDANGNIQLGFESIAGATHYLQIANSAAVNGEDLELQIVGAVTNVDLLINSWGNASKVRFGNHTTGGKIAFKTNESTPGTELILRNTITSDITVFLPTESTTLIGTTDTNTLTNKTIDTASNTITVNESDISDLGSYITADSTDNLTNKTIDASLNTMTGLIIGTDVQAQSSSLDDLSTAWTTADGLFSSRLP